MSIGCGHDPRRRGAIGILLPHVDEAEAFEVARANEEPRRATGLLPPQRYGCDPSRPDEELETGLAPAGHRCRLREEDPLREPPSARCIHGRCIDA